MPEAPAVALSDRDQALLRGEGGEALQFAMQVVLRAATIMRAPCLIDVGFAHIDACHYYGHAHLDFAHHLLERGARFEIPAWTNTVPVSLVQPELRSRADARKLDEARELARLYTALGCRPVWTCAPYQLPESPGFGDHIVGSESNAVAYFNSVVGARTNRYGDFLDVCAGLAGRVPYAGLHTDQGRRGEVVFDVSGLDETLRASEVFCHVLGHLIGQRTGAAVPVITGLPEQTARDSLKAISAASAASGGVALFHAVGVTPEAATLEQACQGRVPASAIRVSADMIARARDSLSSTGAGPIRMVAVGTPHFSVTEFERLVTLLDGRRVHPDVVFYVSTSRHVAQCITANGWMDTLDRAGVTVTVDTCTYFAPAVRACRGRVMTNSAKWAYYAPGMLPVEVAFGSLEDCVRSALRGEVLRDERLWREAGIAR